MKKGVLFIALLVVALFSVPAIGAAVTQEEINTAIEDGIAWLATQQSAATGCWNTGSGDRLAYTGFAVLKLEEYAWEQGMSPFDPAYIYHTNVENGLNCIFTNLDQIAIDPQPAGNPDSDADGIGVFESAGSHTNYNTGIALMAISGSQTPGRVVTVGAFNGKTYKWVATQMVDFLAWSQTDSGAGRGGWDYSYHDSSGSRSDNSNSGWVTLGLGYARTALGIPIPAFVTSELDFWINTAQCLPAGECAAGEVGSSGYTGPNDYNNLYKTGNLLYELKMESAPAGDARVVAALGYIGNAWQLPNMDPGWKDGAGVSNYQATYGLLKGLESYGISKINVGGDPNFDWFKDMVNDIVPEQQASGAWPAGCGNWGTDQLVCTEWALLTIEKAFVGPQPQCSDGVDNDGDGLVDFGPDPGCDSPEDNDETNFVAPEFPTVAVPVSMIFGLAFFVVWMRGRKE